VDGEQWYRVWQGQAAPPLKERATLDSLAYVAERRVPLLPAAQETFVVESNGTQADFERLFRLDWDADEIEAEIARRAPEMEPYLGTLTGLRLLRPSSAVESFFCFLCTPNNNIARITQMVRKLATYGPVLDVLDGRELHRFPTVERIAAIPEQELRAAAFGYRAATIPNIARQVLDRGGEPWIQTLKNVPFLEAHNELISLKGIGHKLADCIALFALHHTESAPVDTHLWQAVTRLYFPEWKDKAITDQRYQAVSTLMRSKFGELTGWAHQYLFYDNVLNWRTRK
jgi:N-glycosylase/DNA lyase